ncbi:MAG: Ig-like domain-containing protein, partial [Fidelibacterota bacterium]
MKRVYRISLLLFFLIVLATSARRIRYFLTEQDFLTNRPVPESEVLNHAHVRAEYDQLDRLIIKAQVDQYGNVLRTENYGYRDSSHVIRQKEVYDDQGNLKYRTTFGPEPQSIAYINYVFGLDSVKKWDDRFTTSELNPRGQPENYRFYDVDAFEYGGMKFDYDSTGRMTRQEWFRRPDDKSMHKFLYDYIPGTDITHIFEYDSNGILVMDVKLSADGTEALLSFINPRDSTVVNNSVVTYDLDDDLQWGKISWIVSGVVDTQEVLLGESGLTRGRHRISFSDETFLRDSMIYNVLFTGMGTKGYRATSRSIHHLAFDISPPVMTLNIASYINEPVVRFMTSEPLDSAFLVWQSDSLLSDTISLTINELMKLSEPFRPKRQTPLRDGNVYMVKLFGFDQAQNLSLPAIADSIHYDITPAVIIIESPAAGNYINHQVVSFKPYETIQNWVVEWIWQSGTVDERAPYRFEFSDTVSAASVSETNLQPYFQPVDGAVYALKITTIDLAGNHSDPVTVDSLHYDVTPPVLTMIFPYDDAAMKNPAISYTVDEPLQAGEFLWTQISGTPDSLSPQVAALAGDELKSQEKIHINLQNEPRLVDGAYYTLTFTGRDLAGNDSEPVVVNRILFDASPPMFSRVKPDSGAALNTVKLSYEISENLAKGSVLWVNTGGMEDPDAPHLAWLEGKELIGEFHRQLTLLNEPNLHDGSVYTLFLTGSDRAGNIADTVKITDVLYDFTAPEIVIEYPKQRSISNTQTMTYTLSEELQSGSFRWIWLGGDPDSLAPYTVTLNEKELLKGRHENVLLDSMPDFRENALYTLIVKGSDRAGNRSKPKMVPGLQYDFTPPVITWYEPKNNAAVNHKKLHYELSELLATGKITWVWTGGSIDPDSVHMVQLAGEELYGQEHPLNSLIKSPPLKDGAIYDIEFSGEDPAGNQSNRINIKNVFYDMTVPRIKPLNPVEYAYISSPAVSYELSEKLDRGEIIYARSSGSIDPASPHKFEMDSTLRSMGIHDSVFKIQGPELVEGGVYTISFSGRDRAGNIASTVQIRGVIYDATPPILTLSFPQSEQAVNHTLVSYGNSENLKSARMTWTRIKGVNDLNSPHVVELADKELEKGVFTDHVLAGNPYLVNGSVYQIEFVGIDFAGNPSDTLKIGPVTYDVTPPTLSFVAPTSNIFTTKTDLTYSLSEDLAQGRLIWEGTGTGGEQLFESFDLLEDAAVAGEHHSDVYYVPDLQDGAVYTVTLEGQDAAGNKAESVQLTNYRVDRTPPQFSAFFVPDHAFIKDLDFGWELSENISSGIIIFKSLKNNQTIPVSLQKDELNGGVRSPGKLLEKIPLEDGALYEIQLVGIDFAGNISDTLTVDSVTYDISPPELVLLKPQKGEHIRETIVRYKTNESLVKAAMVWLVTSQGEKEFSLNQTDLSIGLHSLDNYDIILPENEPIELFIRGSDRAGNQSVTDTITGLTFDQTPPVLALLTPAGNDAVNHTRVSYSTSETLSRASLKWESADNSDPGAPYIINLVENDLLIGDHLEIELSAPPALKDGKRYNITFTGQDLSGNEAKSITVNNILYDVTPPQFSDITPVDSQYIREVNISYTLSENLKSGQIIFENIGGSPDPEKKRIVNLVGKRKLKGPGGGLIPASLIPLVNGSIYRLYFEGIDSAGNTTPETIVDQLTFDNETPVIVLISPASFSFINSEAISYSISEDLAGAEVTLEQVGGNEDPKSPHKVKLTPEARRQGTYSEQIITDKGSLVDGAVYNLTISGRDRAGNEADPALVTMITYDITPPVITIVNPQNNSAINYQTLSYTLSEDLLDGTVNFMPLVSTSQILQQYDVNLTGDELLAGEKDSVALANSRPLINGVTYSMEFSGQDRAGNPAEPATIENVFFDNQAPEASLSKPIDGEQIKNTEITYLLSENLEQGIAVFRQTGGTIDPLSPHKVPLKPEQRSKGLHSDVDIKLDDKLADGGRYSITIEGFDRAGNRVKVIPVKDILFDVRPPQLALLYPPESIAVNRISVSYRTSEEMLKGTITLSRTGGADDPNSPHTYNLTGDQLIQGEHND